MTILAVLLLGIGGVLIASSLDDSSIVDTFKKLIAGQAIDWSGTGKNSTLTPKGQSIINALVPQG